MKFSVLSYQWMNFIMHQLFYFKTYRFFSGHLKLVIKVIKKSRSLCYLYAELARASIEPGTVRLPVYTAVNKWEQIWIYKNSEYMSDLTLLLNLF